MRILRNIFVLALGALALTACHHHDEHSHDHEHAELLLTSYSSDYELFAEVSPLVAGEEAELLCHITRLSDYKPLAEGELSVELLVGGTKISTEAVKPERPGIFHIHLTPSKVGEAKLVFSLKGNTATSFTIDSLKVFDDAHEAHEYAEEHEVSGANTVVFPKEMSWGIDFSVAEVVKAPLGNIIHTVAQVQPSQGDETQVVAKTDGVVTLASGVLTEGTAVSAGKTICVIDASATANNNLAVQQRQLLAELNRAKAEYERVKSLREEKLALESDLSSARAAYESADAAYKALQNGFAKGSQTVTAPRAGYLKQLLVKNGQFVQAGEPVAVITQSRTLQLKAEVASSYYSDLKSVSGANIITRNGAYSLAQLSGRMLSYGRQVDVSSPLIPVIFEINNVVDLLPGTFVDTYILTQAQDLKLCVPAEGVMEEMGNYSVFVQLTPELFEKRQVKVGVTDGVLTEIISGVAEGEHVVGKGAVSLKLQQAAGGLDPHAGHNH